MKRAKSKVPQVEELEPVINQFLTMDTFGPHAKLQPGELREIRNLDIYGDYIRTRRGSSRLQNALAPDKDIKAYVIFDAGDKEYLIIQGKETSTTTFWSVELVVGASWKEVVMKADGITPLEISGTDPADMLVSNGKIYIFHENGNQILEYGSTNENFLYRKMGLPAPQITSVTSPDVADTGLIGKRVWGVELVYKDTSVTPNVDIIISGPNRALKVDNPEFQEGRLAILEGEDDLSVQVIVDPTLNDGTDITDEENSFWTHIRLYRSKDVTTATTSVPELEGEAEIVGRFDELFQVQEMARADFLDTLGDVEAGKYNFSRDEVLDDEMPFPLDIVTGDRMELYPIPPATTGTFHRNRVWASGITDFPGPSGPVVLENIGSKIFFSPETFTKYSENVQALSAIESDPGDGEKMIKVLPFREDLVGIKEGKTGRVIDGNPNSGWITEDHAIGIEEKKFAQYVPQVGICAIVNDQNDFRIFGYDLRWHSTFAGLQISRPIRDIIADWTATDINFMYMNGKLFINGGEGEMLVLAVEQQKGWSRYIYGATQSEVMGTFDEGRRAFIVSKGWPIIEIEVDDMETDYNPQTDINTNIDWFLTTHKWQIDGGRAIIEHRWISIVANLQTQVLCQAYVNGKIWSTSFDLLLDPASYPDAALQETEYQGYAEVKPVGNYLHFELSGTKEATIYSIMLNCLVQRGSIAPGFDPFEVLALVRNVPEWASVTGDIDETGTATTEYDETGTAEDIVEGV